MLDVTSTTTTTITINGLEGERFLSRLAGYEAARVPRALQSLASGDHRSIEVDRRDADQIAAFVDELIEAGWIAVQEPPLLFSPRIGDHVVVRRDVLAEIGREAAGLPPAWGCIPAGTRGKLIGWRDREDDCRAVIDIYDAEHRLVVFVGQSHLTRIARPPSHRRAVKSRHR